MKVNIKKIPAKVYMNLSDFLPENFPYNKRHKKEFGAQNVKIGVFIGHLDIKNIRKYIELSGDKAIILHRFDDVNTGAIGYIYGRSKKKYNKPIELPKNKISKQKENTWCLWGNIWYSWYITEEERQKSIKAFRNFFGIKIEKGNIRK